MIKIKVWYEDDGKYYSEELRNLKPRRYMCGWSFEQLLKYTKEELSWTSINVDSIMSFDIYSEDEHWCQNIRKENEYRGGYVKSGLELPDELLPYIPEPGDEFVPNIIIPIKEVTK